MFFQLELNLCERFPALTPFQIRREKAREVFLLIKRINRYNENNSERTIKSKSNKIRRPAGDNWF